MNMADNLALQREGFKLNIVESVQTIDRIGRQLDESGIYTLPTVAFETTMGSLATDTNYVDVDYDALDETLRKLDIPEDQWGNIHIEIANGESALDGGIRVGFAHADDDDHEHPNVYAKYFPDDTDGFDRTIRHELRHALDYLNGTYKSYSPAKETSFRIGTLAAEHVGTTVKAGYAVVLGDLALEFMGTMTEMPDLLLAASAELDKYNASALAVGLASLTYVLSRGYHLNREERTAREAELLTTPSILQWREINPT